jgi:hypothetical protein
VIHLHFHDIFFSCAYLYFLFFHTKKTLFLPDQLLLSIKIRHEKSLRQTPGIGFFHSLCGAGICWRRSARIQQSALPIRRNR